MALNNLKRHFGRRVLQVPKLLIKPKQEEVPDAIIEAPSQTLNKKRLLEKIERLKLLQSQSDPLSRMQQLHDRSLLEFKQKFMQQGTNYFVHHNQVENGMKLVHQLNYLTIKQHVEEVKEDDCAFYDQYPLCKEVMFLGATNVGKSSLINALNGGQEIARTNKRSGKTQFLHFYLVQNSVYKKKQGIIIDTPGHGYVHAPAHFKEKWKNMIFKYLSYGVRINLIVFLVNAKIGLRPSDIEMLEKLQFFKKPIQVVLTKTDQVRGKREKQTALALPGHTSRQGELIQVTQEIATSIQKYKYVYPEVHLTSAHHQFGIPELRTKLSIAFEENLQFP